MAKPITPDYESTQVFDPDSYRMTIGDHLEELRRRMILGLLGLGAAFVICLIFGERVVAAFCAPLVRVLLERDLSPQLYFTEVSDVFMVYIKISLISAAAISAPWLLYQIWLFVAAGLYPRERKYITRYLPLSIALLISGMLLVYFLVLPWTLQFLIDFGTGIKLPAMFGSAQVDVMPSDQNLFRIPLVKGDPITPQPGDVWFNTIEGRVKINLGDSIRTLMFSPENLIAPLPTLPSYIDMVVGMLLAFGLCFQLPLVVLAVVRLGIVEISALKKGRKYVYFAMAILAAVVTPGDVITATIALMVPLILLYELGIWLAQFGGDKSRLRGE